MPTNTTNYSLIKPEQEEFYDVNVSNENMEKIDVELKRNADGLTTHLADSVAHASYAVNTSGTDSYAVTIPGITEYIEGMVVNFKATIANTTNCSLNINGLGLKALYKITTTIVPLETGDIVANQPISAIYIGTYFVMISPPANTVTVQGVQTLANKTLTTPKIVNGGSIADTNGNEYLKFIQTASAVNELAIKNNTTGNAPELQATGNDPNIDMNLVPKGTGKIKANGKELALQESLTALSTDYALCNIFGSVAQSISNNTYTTLAYDSEHLDSHGMHDNTVNNSRITIQKTGSYLVSAFTSFVGNTNGIRTLALKKNGVTILKEVRRKAVDSFPTDLTTNVLLTFNQGDYIEVQVYQNSGAALSCSESHFFATKVRSDN